MEYYGIKNFIEAIDKIRDKILYCEACGNNAKVFLNNGDQWHLTCCLSRIEELLNDDDFYRCHKTYLVNHCFISEVNYRTNLFVLCNKTEETISYIKLPASYRALKKAKEYLRGKGYEII